MNALKSLLLEQEEELERREKEMVEVYADSIGECLKLAANHLGKEIYQLDYDILKRGKRGFIFTEPYHITVFPVPEDDSLEELRALDGVIAKKGRLLDKDLKTKVPVKNKDGWACIKNYRSGVYFAVFPPIGDGKKISMDKVIKKFKVKGININDEDKVRKIVEEAKGEYKRLWNSSIKAMAEGSVRVDISKDGMKATATMLPPKLGGRDLEVSDITHELKKNNVLYGIKEKEIQEKIDEDQYNIPFIAAMGDPPVNGKNAQIVYHVRTEISPRFKEDESGKVDFKNLDIIENVVGGQLLAEKIPAEKGKYGRNLFNEILDAKDGIDVELHQGKGTILSDDKKQLKAEYNGQVVFADNRINVDETLRINGNVGVKTGNITFLGAVVVTGDVEDNFMIKASGNVEIYGTVEKAQIEADGKILIKQGVSGKDEAILESKYGDVICKFIERATVITDKDVHVAEGIMHSNISAGGKIYCDGKRAQIVGGDLRATQEVRSRILGSPSNPATRVTVGMNPKVLKQIEDIEAKKKEVIKKRESLIKTQKTLKARQEEDPSMFSEENKDYLKKLESGIGKLENRVKEIDKELEKLQAYMEETSAQGRVFVEKTIYRGVYIKIKNADYEVKKETQGKTYYLENDRIKQTNYVDPDKEKKEK